MRITKRTLNDVVILDLSGKLNTGDADQLLKETVDQLLGENVKHIVINLAELVYADSGGSGELFRSSSRLSRAGGRIVVAGVTQKLTDLLLITKILTVFEPFETVEDAVASFGRRQMVEVACPVYGCGGSARGIEGNVPQTLTCRTCHSDFDRPLTRIRLKTYEHEHVLLEFARPALIRCVGRLDLFASEQVERAWRSIPPPADVSIDLRGATDVSEAGAQAVDALRDRAEGRRTEIIWPAGLIRC
jgi:anti-sigma B factor antagonist